MKFASSTGLAVIVTVAALALTSCGSGSGSSDTSGSPGGAVDGKGKTLSVLNGILGHYPEQEKQWQSDIAAKFKAQTGADVKFETFASANDELTRIQTWMVSGQGPDIYGLGTTFTPTAFAGDKPGIGVEFNEEAANTYPYQQAYLPYNRLVDGTVHDW